MIVPGEKPTPFGGISQAGQKWAQEQALLSAKDEFKDGLRDLYIDGTLLWQAQRHRMLGKLEQGGGVARTNKASLANGEMNFLELQDGQRVFASEFLRAPVLAIDAWDSHTHTVETAYTQKHELQVAFGGSSIAGKIESERAVDEGVYNTLDLECIINDDSFLPRDIGIIETVTTTLLQDNEEQAHHIQRADYSISNTLKRSTLQTGASMPDPYEDPEAYRRWATKEHAHLELVLHAPVIEEGSNVPTSTVVVNQRGCLLPSGEIAVASYNRCKSLLAFYATHQYPELFLFSKEETPLRETIADLYEVPLLR